VPPDSGTATVRKREMVFVWKSGTAPHINNFELGQHGRNRTNVWNYEGVNTFRAGRMEELAMHPTVAGGAGGPTPSRIARGSMSSTWVGHAFDNSSHAACFVYGPTKIGLRASDMR
jgi:hypothetical protein